MEKEIEKRILDAFASIRTTDNVKLADYQSLENIKKYYVDPFGYLSSVMTDEDNFIIGRRGTGKSTLLYRAYAECIETWQCERRILPIYVDLSKNDALCSEENETKIERLFAIGLLSSLKESLNLVWDMVVPEREEFIESNLHIQLRECINKLNKNILSGTPVKITSPEKKESVTKNMGVEKKAELGVKRFFWGKSDSESNIQTEEVNTVIQTEFTLADFLDGLSEICEIGLINSIYVFIDEYSELSPKSQKTVAALLKKLRGTRKGIYFKVCAITDNYELGDIRLQRDFYEISLDLYKMFERANGLNDAYKRLGDFTEKIVSERLSTYECGIELKNLLLSYTQAIELLTKSSMGVPRTLGIILKEAWNQTISRGKEKISLDDLKFGIKSSGDGYYGFFTGSVGSVIPSFYGEMLKELVERARKERKSSPNKSAAMFMVGGFRDSHFKYLTENYLIHLVKKDETSVKGETGLNLYMLDWYFIDKYNLGFSLDRDVYRQQRFVYNDVMKNYDVYFTDTRHEFVCPCCGIEYTMDQLYLPQLDMYLDTCPRDRAKLESIKNMDFEEGKYTEIERKIIGTIRNHSYENAILAREVAEIVGCSSIKVGKFAEKVCRETELISREKMKNDVSLRYFRK